jgi:hypothetical protein
MTDAIDSEGELTDMMRGVDVLDKEKNDKPSSAWPIPLNKNNEEANSENKDNKDNKDNLDKEKSTPIT